MSEAMVADAVLRQFLLDKVDTEERQRIESLFITDPLFNERLLALEQDLIDDYFEGSLTQVELDSFRQKYAATAQQRRKLDVSRSVKEWADSQRHPSPLVLRKRSVPRGLLIPIAAAIIIGTVLLVIWIGSGLERRRHVAHEEELARINSRAALADNPVGMLSLTLSPVNTRTIDSGSEVDTGDAQLIELRLLWIREQRYSAYRVVLKRVGGTEAFTIQSVHAEDDNPNVVRVRIPRQLLSRGQFRVALVGVTPEAQDGVSDEYSFSVSR